MSRIQRKLLQKRRKRIRIIKYIATASTIITGLLVCIVLVYSHDVFRLTQEQKELKDFNQHYFYLNPDYAGWLQVSGTDIDFPVVRGNDNSEYLHTNFLGEENILGAIFMDYRCNRESRHTIIYGHDAQDYDGNRLMFGTLRSYLDNGFWAAHPVIAFATEDEVKEYRIFSVRASDINDAAYHLDFNSDEDFKDFAQTVNAPEGTDDILTLSTCLGTKEDKRLIIQAAYVQNQ